MLRNSLGFPKSQGHFCSWCSTVGGLVKIFSRIDHCIANGEWLMKYTECVVQYLNPRISDHYPLLMEMSGEVQVEEGVLGFSTIWLVI